MRLSITNRGFRKIAYNMEAGARRRIVNEYLARSGLSHASAIHTFTKQDELETLLNLALALPNGARVLEIGSYLGAASCHLAAGLFDRKGTIYCVDTWNNETMPDGTRDTFTEFSRNVAPVANMIRMIRKPSAELASDELETPLDLIFLDGDHSYEAARTDFGIASPLLAEDGVLALHDTWFYPGVSRLLGEALASGRWRLSGHTNNLSWIRRAT